MLDLSLLQAADLAIAPRNSDFYGISLAEDLAVCYTESFGIRASEEILEKVLAERCRQPQMTEPA
ncbi:hypothetical protein D3C81_2192730 [compost metagenome]